MPRNRILFAFIGLVVGFFIGFILANTVSHQERREITDGALRVAPDQTTPSREIAANPASGQGSVSLSKDEIKRAVAVAEANPRNLSMQRNMGQGLYLYAMQMGDATVLPDAVRFLKRTYEAQPADYDTIVLLGNALFESGQKLNPQHFAEARQFYTKALQSKPNDADVRTDLGLTYYFGRPPEPERAIAEFRRALTITPRHEPALQSLAAALVNTGNYNEAQARIDELRRINPSNPVLPRLQAQLTSKSGAKEEN